MTLFRSFLTLALFATALTLGAAVPALADTVNTFTDQSKHVAKQVGIVPNFIAVICYVIGVYFTVRGLLSLRSYIIKPDDVPITQTISLLMIAAFLIVLPYAIDMMADFLGADVDNEQNMTIMPSASAFSSTGSVGK